jgi:hypothetical protein
MWISNNPWSGVHVLGGYVTHCNIFELFNIKPISMYLPDGIKYNGETLSYQTLYHFIFKIDDVLCMSEHGYRYDKYVDIEGDICYEIFNDDEYVKRHRCVITDLIGVFPKDLIDEKLKLSQQILDDKKLAILHSRDEDLIIKNAVRKVLG